MEWHAEPYAAHTQKYAQIALVRLVSSSLLFSLLH